MARKPYIGQIVHYQSYGTPGGEYPSVCRAAIVTAVDEYQPPADGKWFGHVDLAVLNPEGAFFNRGVHQDDGAETSGSPDCEGREFHGNPFRYCQCGWMEAQYRPGTWHEVHR